MRRMNNETTIHTQTENTYYYRTKCAEPHSLTGSSGRPDTQPEGEERWIYNSQWTAMQLLYFFFGFIRFVYFRRSSQIAETLLEDFPSLFLSLSLVFARCCLIQFFRLISFSMKYQTRIFIWFLFIWRTNLWCEHTKFTQIIHTHETISMVAENCMSSQWTLRIDFLNVHLFWLFRTMPSLQHPCVLRIARLFGVFGLYSCRNQIFSIVFRVPEFVSADIVTFVMFWMPR